MNDCSRCKFCDIDYIFDEDIGEEYPLYSCEKGNDTSLDFECDDFEEYKPKPYKERDTKCDKCESLTECINDGLVLDCTNELDYMKHYIVGRCGCKKKGVMWGCLILIFQRKE